MALNGGTIRDRGGKDATLTLAAPDTAAGSLGANKNLVIDTSYILGDMNGDNVLDNFDIGPFELCL